MNNSNLHPVIYCTVSDVW